MKKYTYRRIHMFIIFLVLSCACAFAQADCANAPISFSPGSQNQTFVAAGGSGVIGVLMQSDCKWHPATNTSFLHLGQFVGLGQGNAFFSVDANPNLAARSGTIAIFGDTSGSSATATISQNAATGDFQLGSNPTSQTVTKGSNVSFTVSIARSGGFTGTVFLSATGQPSGVSTSFNPSAVTGSSSTMMVTVSASAPTGNFPLTISGVNGNVARSTTVTLIIQPVCGNEVCATMQTDGNFVVNGPGGNTTFQTNTSGSGAAIIRVQDDGNIVLYKEVWQAGTYVTPNPGPFPTQTCPIATLLHAPQSLTSGQCIISPNGQYILYMAPDGNFYIYNIAIGSGTWGAGTSGHPGAVATLQTDGNFVVYDSVGTPLWNSGTNGSGADLLNMENDGRIILYRPIWQSGTSRGWSTTSVIHPTCDVGPGTGWTGVLGANQCFVSPDGRYELLLQPSGELVLTDNAVTPPTVLWQRP